MNVDNDFHHDSRPLVVDHITGVRSFAIDKLGRLTGVTHQDVWRPGVNEAVCKIATRMESTSSLPIITAYLNAMSGNYGTLGPTRRFVAGADAGSTDKVPAKHPAGTKGCQCGYWAYFDGSDDFARDSTVTAIVQGQGVVTVGSKGFRAEKGEIVALVDPSKRWAPEDEQASGVRIHKAWDRYSDLLNAMGPLGVVLGVMAVVASVWLLAAAVTSSLWWGIGAATLLALGVSMVGATFHGMSREFDGIHPELTCADKQKTRTTYRTVSWHTFGGEDEIPVTRSQWEASRLAYPDIPVYPTLQDALRDFPLTPPPAPEPITPANTPDFWERSA